MRAILKRVGRLEDRYQTELSGKPKKGHRVILSLPWKGPPDLANSTCQRYLSAGCINEFVKLDGADDAISDEELEKFIESFPIHVAGGEMAG
jgi:hypothetical protein